MVRAAARPVALLATETAAIRRAQAPNHECVYPTSDLYTAPGTCSSGVGQRHSSRAATTPRLSHWYRVRMG